MKQAMNTRNPELLAEVKEAVTALQNTVSLLKLAGLDAMAIAAGLAMVSAQECKAAYGDSGAAAITAKALSTIS